MTIRGFEEFIDDERKKTLAEFYQECFDAMNRNRTNALILDLRNYGGGLTGRDLERLAIPDPASGRLPVGLSA